MPEDNTFVLRNFLRAGGDEISFARQYNNKMYDTCALPNLDIDMFIALLCSGIVVD